MGVMRRAWEIAREGAGKFGGSPKEYINSALEYAHEENRCDVYKGWDGKEYPKKTRVVPVSFPQGAIGVIAGPVINKDFFLAGWERQQVYAGADKICWDKWIAPATQKNIEKCRELGFLVLEKN